MRTVGILVAGILGLGLLFLGDTFTYQLLGLGMAVLAGVCLVLEDE